jgi:hypothetical protein
MTAIAAPLLNLLVSRFSGGCSGEASTDADFTATLNGARPVTAAEGVDIKLSDEQWGRLSKAADAAQAQGATRALVLLDGEAFTLDVTTRQVLGKANLASGRATTGIDAVIQAPAAGTANAKESSSNELLAALAARRSARAS